MSYAMFDHDQEAFEDLLQVVNPDDHDIVLLGALCKRYPLRSDMGYLARDIAGGWGLSESDLDAKCRGIWASGYRPKTTVYGVGSANDTLQEDL